MGTREKRQQSAEEGSPGWMTSYADLVTNLLCLFVLLFSFAIIDKQKFEAVANSMRSAFSHKSGESMDDKSGDTVISLTPFPDDPVNNIDDGEENGDGTEDMPDDRTEDKTEDFTDDGAEETDEKLGRIAEIKEVIIKLVESMGLNENIKVIEERDIVIFRIDSSVLFDTGKADLKDQAKPVIAELGDRLKEIDTEIVVQGHADDRPINTALFPSNWELSTKRATNVIKYMVEISGIDQRYLTATGNAEFKPIVPNDSEYNRQKNRRIDIIITK